MALKKEENTDGTSLRKEKERKRLRAGVDKLVLAMWKNTGYQGRFQKNLENFTR